MAGKTAILAVRIIGDESSAVKAYDKTAAAGDKWAKGLDKLQLSAGVAGAAAGAALAAGYLGAVEKEGGQKRVQDQLGLSDAEAATAGAAAGELYAEGFGDSMPTVNAAISSVMGNIDGMRGAAQDDLQAIAGQVLNVADTFEQDLGGVTTAVGQLMRTGMAPDAQSALDLITKGLQSNSRAGEDLLDTFTEYPALFQRLGIDGATATGLISQGLDAGARSTDLVADALKEFQIRATDGSTTSAAGFEALGLSAESMTAQIAAGGDGAKAGLDQVLDGLRNMTDPVAQNAAAVALFGTQAEDLGGALFALDPSTAVAALGEVQGATEKIGATEAETAIVTLQRSFETSFSAMAASAIPVITPILEKLTEFAPILGPLAVVLGIASAAVLGIAAAMQIFAAAQAIQTVAQWASNAAWLANPITWIVLAVVAAIAIMVAAVLLIIDNWDELAKVADDVWSGIMDWIDDVVGAIENLIGWVQDALGWFGSLFGAQDTAKSKGDALSSMAAASVAPEAATTRTAMFSPAEAQAGFAGLSSTNTLSIMAAPTSAPSWLGDLARPQQAPQIVNHLTVTIQGAVDKDGTARTIKKLLKDYDTQNGTLVAGGAVRR